MTWDVDFYSACTSDADFTVTALAYEYKADAVLPFATYQMIGGNGTQDLQGHSVEGERLVQLSVWASSPTQAKELAEHAIDGVTSSLNVISVFERSLGRDSNEDSFGYAVDFVIWFQSR